MQLWKQSSVDLQFAVADLLPSAPSCCRPMEDIGEKISQNASVELRLSLAQVKLGQGPFQTRIVDDCRTTGNKVNKL